MLKASSAGLDVSAFRASGVSAFGVRSVFGRGSVFGGSAGYMSEETEKDDNPLSDKRPQPEPEAEAGEAEAEGVPPERAPSMGGGMPSPEAPPLWRDVLSVLAQSYLAGWGMWGSLLAFFQSFWWHFLDSKNLGISIYAIGMLLTVFMGIFLVGFSFNCCINAAQPIFDKGIEYHWVFQGVIPAVAMLLSMIPNGKVRTFMTVVASASALAGLNGAMAAAEDSKLSQRVPTTVVLGLLMLQAVRLGCSSAMPSYGEHGCLHTTLLAARLTAWRCCVFQMPATPPGPSSPRCSASPPPSPSARSGPSRRCRMASRPRSTRAWKQPGTAGTGVPARTGGCAGCGSSSGR